MILGEHGIAQVTVCTIVKNLGGIKIRVSQREAGDFIIPKTISPRAKGNNATIARRSEVERRVVHTKLAYEHFRDAQGARRYGDDFTTKCLLKMVPWETEESVVSGYLSRKTLRVYLRRPRQGKCRARDFASGGTVRSDRRGRRDGKAHARGVRVSVEFCNRRLVRQHAKGEKYVAR